MRNSEWVLFLASRVACQSASVNQEIGASVILQKNLIPVVWEIKPEELPAWAKEYQAINIANDSAEIIGRKFSDLAQKIKSSKQTGFLICAALFALFFVYLSRE